jgi:hypothetical protein
VRGGIDALAQGIELVGLHRPNIRYLPRHMLESYEVTLRPNQTPSLSHGFEDSIRAEASSGYLARYPVEAV